MNKLTGKRFWGISAVLAFAALGCATTQQSRQPRRETHSRAAARADAQAALKKAAISIERKSYENWYSGGTLHKAKMRDWYRATPDNRLATCADFAANNLLKQGKSFSNMTQYEAKAQALVICITESGAGGAADNQDIVQMWAACHLMLER